MKYLLSWMGKWEIRCYFDPSALIVTPVMNYELCISYYHCWIYADNFVIAEFTQIGDPFLGIASLTSYAGTLTLTASAHPEIWRCRRMQCNTVESNLATFQLRADVVEELKSTYIERPLTFPLNFFTINRFAGRPNMVNLSHIIPSRSEYTEFVNLFLQSIY
jgi:hypothetical protein